jgi:CRP-like cAMP-binding protein
LSVIIAAAGLKTNGELVMNKDTARSLLEESQVFKGLGSDFYNALMEYAEQRNFEQGEFIFKGGEPRTTTFYLIVEGTADVEEPSGQVQNKCEPGEILGEIGQLDPVGKRTRTVKAASHMELLMWDFDDVLQMAGSHKEELLKRCEELAFNRLAQDL